jgi:hypothetical protein
MALLNVSDPGQQVVDALSRLSHDADTEVAQNAVVALGIVGAGTNNARLAGEAVTSGWGLWRTPVVHNVSRCGLGIVGAGTPNVRQAGQVVGPAIPSNCVMIQSSHSEVNRPMADSPSWRPCDCAQASRGKCGALT